MAHTDNPLLFAAVQGRVSVDGVPISSRLYTFPETTIASNNASANFMQVIPMTHEERVKTYMKKCTKKQIAEMLANCNEILEALPPRMYYYGDTGKWEMLQDGNGILRTRENLDIK